MPPIELARPSRNVVSVASASALQYCFKNSGKNADITVMANAELAQSYKAQDMTVLRSSIHSSGAPWSWKPIVRGPAGETATPPEARAARAARGR